MRTLRIKAKCTDRCTVAFEDTEEDITKEKFGYVPRNIGIGGGDYIDILIDIDSGQVIGWDYPENEDIIESLDQDY